MGVCRRCNIMFVKDGKDQKLCNACFYKARLGVIERRRESMKESNGI
jgi:hypothetical protein|tara:strand:- start:8317 stop:8457 length:141 start_codon:yes stop_codon:yes gene_type:complete